MTLDLGTSSTGGLARSLLSFVDREVAALADGPLNGFDLPRLLLAQEVGPDVRADLLFTVGLLHECGQREVAGRPIPEVITQLLQDVQGGRTNTFYSYRVAETVARFGPFAGNPVLADLDDAQREQVARAADSTDWIPLLDEGVLPRNYAAVLARCEQARRQLGLLEDESTLAMLHDRVRALLGGYLDDSNNAIGRYDIYTVDIYLFCEPMASIVGEPWRAGVSQMLELVRRTATPDGSAVAWGRSTGLLALCHTIELAGLVARHGLTEDPGHWYARAADAATRLDGWFQDGWANAHQHRSSDPYRGLDRRLQLTLDCLGKLVDTAVGLQAIDDTPFIIDHGELFPDRDEVAWLDRSRHAGVWSFRSRGTAFTLPLVGGTTTDYLPAPRMPGLFEAPVGNDLVTGAPLVHFRGKRFASGGLPARVEHSAGAVEATYDGFPQAGHLEPQDDAPVFAGRRQVTWSVDGRTFRAHERLEFERPPHGLAVQVAEAEDRPLRVEYECDAPSSITTVDADGIAEYRSCWGELRTLHQIDIAPARSVELRWSVTPLLRVVSTAAGHHYNDSLYAPLLDRVRVERLPFSTAASPDALARLAARTDQFHLHWPEWLLIGDVGPHQELIDRLRAGRVRIVWTQHNLVPHSKDPAMVPVYEAWARAADLVIHHTDWGRDRALATYVYGPHTRHVVIAHGHFGTSAPNGPVEAERTGTIRLGIVGAPRAEKDVELVMRAVARCGRDDLELLVLSLDGTETVPDDPRIDARSYEMVDRAQYDQNLAALDVLVMPFDPEGEMLATGTVGDAIGFGLPTLASSWPFLTETLGDAAIVYGSTEDDLLACLDALDHEQLRAAAHAAVARRPRYDWSTIAEQTYLELDALGSLHH